jgi:L,D-transpeptidase-like protein
MRSRVVWLAIWALLTGGPLAAEEVPTAEGRLPAAQTPSAPIPSSPVELAALPLLEQLPPPPPQPPPITLVLKADLGAQRITVIENGKERHVWAISSGRPGFATKTGTFRPQWASRMWHSRQYEYAPMPHAVFFNHGTAFHGTSAVGLLGRPASHGCIRLAPGHAAMLFKLVHKHGYAQTKVVVHGGSKGKGPAVAGSSDRRRIAAYSQASRREGYRATRSPARQTSNWPF